MQKVVHEENNNQDIDNVEIALNNDEPFGADMSSIMMKADQIDNFNIADDE